MNIARGPLRRCYSSSGLRPRLDYKQICRDQEMHRRNAEERRMPMHLDQIVESYGDFRRLTDNAQQLERRRNELASLGGLSPAQREEATKIKSELVQLKADLERVNATLDHSGMSLPNFSDPASPFGMDNEVLETFGPPIDPTRGCIDHVELGEQLGILDFQAGTKVAGSRHYFLRGRGAMLELALIQYAIKVCLQNGFQLAMPPDLAMAKFIPACGFNPRRLGDALPIYSVSADEETAHDSLNQLALIGTSEIPLAAQHHDSILQASGLPIKTVALSHCFRPEVGHHGQESRGLYRVHQFSKVEMFVLCEDGLETSRKHFQEIVELQKEILGGLGLSCRLLRMAREELGSSAYSKYDIETWFPGRQGYGELTSASNCTDHQSRRLNVRFRDGYTGPLRFPHTLNGTACAIPRTIQAILENYQSQGGVKIPPVLQPFMLDGSDRIELYHE